MKRRVLKLIPIAALCILMSSQHAHAMATHNGGGEDPKKDKSKTHVYHNNSSVKIFSPGAKKGLHVKAKKNRRMIDFFVFDLEGNLVQNYRMRSKDQKKLIGLKKGVYIYRVFCGDEEEVSGKIDIK